MAIVIKSNIEYIGETLLPSLDAYEAYVARVETDGGVIKNSGLLTDMFFFMEEQGIDSSKIFSATSVNWGIKESGGNVTKLYNLYDPSGDIELISGAYPIQSKNGKLCFYSAGTGTNHLRSVGTITTLASKNLSLFNVYEKGASTTAAGSPVSELWGVGGTAATFRGLTANFAHNTNTYAANGIGTSGALVGIPYADNISLNVSSNGIFAYQDGVKVAEDLTISTITSTEFRMFLASQNASLAGAQGYYYCNIAAKDLTQAENIALSNFVAEFI